MRGRQKRLKSAESFGGEAGDLLILVDSELSPCSSMQNVTQCQVIKKTSENLSANDCGNFTSRCSIRMVHEVVSKFDIVKQELVKSIGFGGILHFPPMKQVNRKFSFWLMSRVDEVMSVLKVGEHIRMSFNKDDVGRIFGIPSVGKSVIHAGVGSREAKDRVIDRYLGQEFKEQRSIKMVQEVLERDYDGIMSEIEADIFRVCFVVFVVSNLFCPSAKYDYASVDYWNAIQDAKDIQSYDWSAYVLTRLLDAVTKMKQDIGNNIKFPNITGCAIFLQVLYLDSLQLDGLTLAHDTLPRIRVFSFDTIRNMMQADRNFSKDCISDGGLQISKLRDACACIYSWALDKLSYRSESRSEGLNAVWETSMAMVHLLGLPLEAAGPVFVAVLDFQEQMNSSQFVHGNEALKFLSVLLTLMTPFTRGFRYQPSYSTSPHLGGEELVGSAISNGTKLLSVPIRNRQMFSSSNVKVERGAEHRCGQPLGSFCGTSDLSSLRLQSGSIGDDVQRSVQRAVEAKDEPPGLMDVNLRVAAIMAKFYSLFRLLKPQNELDLNASSGCVVSSPSTSGSSNGSVCDNLLSPWEIGYEWSIDAIDGSLLFGLLNGMDNDESMAVVHRGPKYIQVSNRAMFAQFRGFCEIEVDLFDALVRRIKQEDDSLYAAYGSLRWRLFFESDFMASVLSGELDLMDANIHEHLAMCQQIYDMKTCKLVFFPALLHHQWVCFVWQPEVNTISVFDPSHEGRCPEWRCQLVECACFMLKHVLFTLSKTVFKGVVHDVRNADLRVMNVVEKGIGRVNRTGVICCMFHRCYDGEVLTGSGLKADVDLIAAKLLADLSSLKGNSGSLKLIH